MIVRRFIFGQSKILHHYLLFLSIFIIILTTFFINPSNCQQSDHKFDEITEDIKVILPNTVILDSITPISRPDLFLMGKLHHDDDDKIYKKYKITKLKPRTSYEIKISYSAITPATFSIDYNPIIPQVPKKGKNLNERRLMDTEILKIKTGNVVGESNLFENGEISTQKDKFVEGIITVSVVRRTYSKNTIDQQRPITYFLS